MSEMWILYANIAVWVGLGIYITILSFQQKKLNKKFEELEEIDDKDI